MRVVALVLVVLAAACARSDDSEDRDARRHQRVEPTTSAEVARAARSPRATAQKPARRQRERAAARIRWRDSKALGLPQRGRLVRGVQLPAEGTTFFTWDPVRRTSPNRGWRRWGTDRLVRVVLKVVRGYAAEHPRAPRVGVGDLSRPRGGDFGPRFGLPGHVSHQNGLDVDVYYPRLDRRERAPRGAGDVDRRLAQALVDLFVEAGADLVFVGPSTGLTGPRRVVQPLARHDNHLHVRLPGRSAG
ncbi:MAG TPA: penicillin-insensitive murein endopeptidase [Gaiellaceae bacterium]|nr:penicillin-insensitive murein endopeptidase [Gaiellaceae bacterium]